METMKLVKTLAGCCVFLAACAVTVWQLVGSAPAPQPAREQIVVEPIRREGHASHEPVTQTDPPLSSGDQQEKCRESDELVRRLVSTLSSHPKLTAWLVTDDLLHRFVATVESIAGGYSPRDELGFLKPLQPLSVQRAGSDRLVITPASFRRYDLATQVFVSLDSDAAVAVYRQLEEQLKQAHRQTAWFGPELEVRMRQAIDHLLAVEVPQEELEVKISEYAYVYADERLEKLSGAQRQLLRTGPSNARRIQEKLLELRAAFGWNDPGVGREAAMVQAQRAQEPELQSMQLAELTPDQEQSDLRGDGAAGEAPPAVGDAVEAQDGL